MTTAYDLAKAEVGTVEWAKGDNPKVVAYFKDSGNPGVTNDETAWCAACRSPTATNCGRPRLKATFGPGRRQSTMLCSSLAKEAR